MHSSIGTGSLAYVVGSKVMDMRTSSKDEREIGDKIEQSTSNDNNVEVGKSCERDDLCTDVENAIQHESSSDWVDLVSIRASIDGAEYDSSSPKNYGFVDLDEEAHQSLFETDDYSDFPALPVTNLFEKSGKDNISCMGHDVNFSGQRNLRFEDERMHSFEISNNVDLVSESSGQQPLAVFHPVHSEIGIVSPKEDENNPVNEPQVVHQLRISDGPEPAVIRTSISERRSVNEDRVSEWLWILHRIGIFTVMYIFPSPVA